MKLSFTYAFAVPNFSKWIKPSLVRNLHQSVCCYSLKSAPSTSLKPQIPLFLRPPTHTATLSDLKKWHEWAKSLASSVGTAFVDLDNGPDSSLLCRELKWLMEDVTKDCLLPCQIPSEKLQGNVGLRVSLEDLYRLWNQRIEERRPFQYIVGCEYWRDLVLCVEEGVLIPRPETEQIVDMVADVVSDNEGLRKGLWVDLGTGSGAIAIGIGKILKSWGRVIATDLSPLALAVAAFNVQRYDLQDIIELRQGSWFEPLKDSEGKLAGIISNPPYIPSSHISGLQAEVGRHEPVIALDGGVDGTDDLLHLCKGAASMLKPGGFFAFETNGEEQCKRLVDYMETDAGDSFLSVKIMPDFAGIHRFVTGFRK
ncbi:Modification methylase HemK [Trema orientale]|uniref:Modification methylase HemK n=1 Tax=Trema orientale TaxID=63057 RepID=A0A2P5FZK1_TREOI|nr:Modification methylase HemK [Trema orientale]